MDSEPMDSGEPTGEPTTDADAAVPPGPPAPPAAPRKSGYFEAHRDDPTASRGPLDPRATGKVAKGKGKPKGRTGRAGATPTWTPGTPWPEAGEDTDDGVADDDVSGFSDAFDDEQVVVEEVEDRRVLYALLGILAVLVVGGLGWMVFGGDDEEIADGPTTTAAAAPGATTTTTVAGTPGGTGAPAPVADTVRVEIRASGAWVGGKVPTEDLRTMVMGGATILYQPGLVEDGLEIDPKSPEINPNEDLVIKALGEPVLQGIGAIGVSVSHSTSEGVVILGGSVRSQVAKDRIVGAVAGVAGGLDKVIDQIKLSDGTAPSTSTTTTAKPNQPTTTAKPGATTVPTTPTTAPAPTTTVAPGTETPADVQVRLDELFTGKVIEFGTGSTALTTQWELTVEEVANALRDNAARLQIAGHTDNVGDPTKNLNLSVLRAESIKAAIVARGIAPERITTIGYGQARPVADNSTPAGRQQNRRIEFVVAR